MAKCARVSGLAAECACKRCTRHALRAASGWLWLWIARRAVAAPV